MIKYLASFIKSTGISCMDIEREWSDPTTQEEFRMIIAKINTKNVNRDKFPLTLEALEWNDYINFIGVERVNEGLYILRIERNKILQSTDWVLTHDNAISLINLDEWIQYRKTLRDFLADPSFTLIFKDGTNDIDKNAMGFPPVQPPILRK